MPLHLICQCCKCKNKYYYFDLWSISRNHKYSYESRKVCKHFDVEIDHESSIGFLGIGWSNHITISAYYKYNYERQIIINDTFNSDHTEQEGYKIFSNKIVFHAKISDYKNNAPTCGFKYQNRLDAYEEQREQQRLNELRRQEEENKKKQIESEIDEIIEKNKITEESKNILIFLENICSEIQSTSTLLLEDVTKEKSIRETFHNNQEIEMIRIK